jgi:hypothetical protein
MTRMLFTLALVLIALAAHARDRSETCSSYQRATGTIVTDCRSPNRKPTHCETVEHITGSTTTECR